MVAEEAKEVTSVRRGGRGRATVARSENLPVSNRRSLHGFRATTTTQQWVEDRAHCREDKPSNSADVSSNGAASRTPSKKEGSIQFKQENDHSAAKLASPVSSQNSALCSLRKDGFSDAQAAALSPINLNSLPGFRQEFGSSNSSSKRVSLPDSSSHHQTQAPVLDVPDTLTDGTILLQQAVPSVRNEGGERKVVWCNPAFCEDSADRRFSNDSAASAQTQHPSYLKSVVDFRGVREGQELTPSQETRRQPMVVVGQDEKPSSSPLRINNGVYSPEKFSAESSPLVSVGAVAGSPATGIMNTVEGRGRSLRVHFELESASGNWYTPVMSSVTPEAVANSLCPDRVTDCSSRRTRRTLAQLPTLKDASSSQAFFSSTANHHMSGLAPSVKDDILGEKYRRRPPSAYHLNYASETTAVNCNGSDRRSPRKLQPVVDEEAVKSHKSGSRVGRPTCRGGDVTSSAQAAPQADFEAMVEADLEADIAREMEEEIAKEILYLSQRLAALHAKQEQRRVAWGGSHGCPQTPLRCAPSPPQTPPPASSSTIHEEKQRPASERRSGRVVAAKFLQSTAERKGVQSVDRSSRRRLLADSTVSTPLNLSRRSLGTPARLLAKFNPLPSGGTLGHHCTEQGLNSKCHWHRSKVSAEEYVRERSLADGRSKSKNKVLKEAFREDLETARLVDATNHSTCNVERSHQNARSLSIGSAVQSRYFPEFERKIDWVKTLRSDTIPHSTIVPLNPVEKLMDDNSVSRQTSKDVLDIDTWLGENHGNAGIEEEISTHETEREPNHPPLYSSHVHRRDQSSSHTPRLKGRVTQQQPRPVVSPSPTRTKAARPCTTPTRNTQSSVAAARSCSPSVRARTVPSRYGTPLRANSQTPGTGDLKRVGDPKLVLESPVKKIDHALRSAGKESVSSSGTTKGRALVKKPTIRKGYPGVAGLMSTAESGGTDADVQCSRRHHHHPSPVGKAKDRRSTVGGRDECMKRKDNFEAEYEKFVESSEIPEKQVSELYHAAMENVSAAESSPESEILRSTNGHSSSARPAKRTFIRCGELIKDKAKLSDIMKGKRTPGQSVLPPTDGQDSDDSVLARSLPRTESSDQNLEWELITDDRDRRADEQGVENVEVEVTEGVDRSKQTPVWNGSAIDASMVGTLLQREETLIDERQRLSKIKAKSEGGQQQSHDDESPRDSGCVKRNFDQHKVHPFSEHGKGQSHWHYSDNAELWPDEVEGLDFESSWCLAGEVEASITLTRP